MLCYLRTVASTIGRSAPFPPPTTHNSGSMHGAKSSGDMFGIKYESVKSNVSRRWKFVQRNRWGAL